MNSTNNNTINKVLAMIESDEMNNDNNNLSNVAKQIENTLTNEIEFIDLDLVEFEIISEVVKLLLRIEENTREQFEIVSNIELIDFEIIQSVSKDSVIKLVLNYVAEELKRVKAYD
ncbi:hypothetical protein [Staphylococcus kloosii]|jgi:hypothetical protein|uniref:hypothetical protein n=1 Tax=Staphylococcus kloosii TaxID=29384 RepID=UPI00189D8506|nr:hypothetical protein [Staphylococcus kloosii]MBF7023644.1 hypothetical protein [Staphylococcus kloosii]